jgi:hypothetical protein
MDAPDSEYLSCKPGFDALSTPCWSLPAEVLDRCSDDRGWSCFARFADGCLATLALRFEGRGASTRRPELARMRPMASAAEPLASFSACSSISFLESLSHQNSHALESRERPLADRRNDVEACSRDTRVRSRDDTAGPWLLLTDCLSCCDARGGDGDGLSLVTIFAAPSEVIERRTKEDDFFRRRSESLTVICSRPGRYSACSGSSLKDDARRLFAR